MRQLSAEGVLGLNPSLVLAMQGSGPKETIDVLEAAKVPLVMVPETFSEQGLIDKIKLVGHAMGADPRAECLTKAVAGDLAQLRELRAKVTKPVRVMFVMSLLERPRHGGGPEDRGQRDHRSSPARVNAIDSYEGYKIINDEAIVAAKPDVVLSIAARQGFGRRGRGLRPSGLCDDAGRGQQGLHLDGRPLSARLRPAHRGGRARSRRSSSIRRWRRRRKSLRRPR